MTKRNKIVVDKQFKTNVDGVYAIGDVIDGPMLAHKACPAHLWVRAAGAACCVSNPQLGAG